MQNILKNELKKLFNIKNSENIASFWLTFNANILPYNFGIIQAIGAHPLPTPLTESPQSMVEQTMVVFFRTFDALFQLM